MEDETLTKRERQKKNKEEKRSSVEKSSMQNKLMVVGAIIAIAAGAFWFMYRGGNGADDANMQTEVVAPPSEITESDHAKVNIVEETPQQVAAEDEQVEPSDDDEIAVTIVEYGDFQCPACAAYHPIVKQLLEDFPNDLRVVFRHFPLRSIHRHAQISSQAAEAAGMQDKFWEMHDKLFEGQEDWSNVRDPRSIFKEYAAEIELDVDKFDADMNSAEAKAVVDAHYESGIAAAVDSTPTFFVNGSKVQSPQGYEPFAQLVQQIIEEDASPPSEEITPTL